MAAPGLCSKGYIFIQFKSSCYYRSLASIYKHTHLWITSKRKGNGKLFVTAHYANMKGEWEHVFLEVIWCIPTSNWSSWTRVLSSIKASTKLFTYIFGVGLKPLRKFPPLLPFTWTWIPLHACSFICKNPCITLSILKKYKRTCVLIA